MTSIPSLGGRLKLGAGWCNIPSPVLRGAGNESLYGRDSVAPPGNQAATENTNVCLTSGENPAYSPVLVRQAKLGVSCRVQVPVGRGVGSDSS